MLSNKETMEKIDPVD